jgi:hypothetical protein
MNEGRIIEDDEIKNNLTKRPYKQWLTKTYFRYLKFRILIIPFRLKMLILKPDSLFGYTIEDLKNHPDGCRRSRSAKFDGQ